MSDERTTRETGETTERHGRRGDFVIGLGSGPMSIVFVEGRRYEPKTPATEVVVLRRREDRIHVKATTYRGRVYLVVGDDEERTEMLLDQVDPVRKQLTEMLDEQGTDGHWRGPEEEAAGG